MSDTAHVLEEVRSLRGAHAELMGEMRQLCLQVRELVIELRHTQGSIEDFKEDMEKMQTDIHSLQLDNALNKPILDLARAMNAKMWLSLLGAASTVIAISVDWSKVFGG